MLHILVSLIITLAAVIAPDGDVIDQAEALLAEGHFREAATMLHDALPALRETGDEDAIAECLSMLAVSYSRLGAYDLAVEAQGECYEIDLKNGDPANISSSLNNLAGFCLAMEKYDEGERLIREAIAYEEKLGESASLAVRYGMACDILLKQGKVDEAIDYASRALAIDTAGGRAIQAAIRKSQLAAAYMEKGRFTEASSLLDEAATVFTETNNLHSLSVCRQQQGTIAAKQGQFDKAAHHLREALTLSRQTGNILLQKNISQDLATALMDRNPREAVTYLQDVITLSDTLYKQETAAKIAELSIQNEMADQEKTLSHQARILRIRQAWLCILAIFVVLLCGIVIAMHRALTIRRKNHELLQKTSELKDKLLILQKASPDGRNEEVEKIMQDLADFGGKVPDKSLTAREAEIARLCCKGLLSKEIADQLNISQRTVETHKNNIFRKLEINSTAELIELMGGVTK